MAVRDLPARAALLALLVGLLGPALPGGSATGAEGGARPLAPPQWVAVTEIKGKALLTWIRNPDFATVRILRRLKTEGTRFEPVGETRENTFLDSTIPGGGVYVYRLVGVARDGKEGVPSAEASVRITAIVLKPPSPPQWEGHLFLRNGVGLKWVQREGEDVLTYNIYRRTPPETEFRLIGSSRGTSYLDQGVEPDGSYVYALSALDSTFRETPLSAELAVRYLPSVPAPAEKKKEVVWRTRRTRHVATLLAGEIPFLHPADVAVGPLSGNIYLADAGNNCIQVFDQGGTFLRLLGGQKSGAFRFRRLLGLALDREERLYGVDAGESAVISVLPDGSELRRRDVKKEFPGVELGLIDLLPLQAGRLFVVDNYNNRVIFLGPEAAERTFGSLGEQPGEFSAPTFCARDGSGNIYVAEALNARVQVFTASGEFLRAFGVSGRGPGGFGRPKGVALGSTGEVYVSDSWLNRIQVFSPEGEFVAVLTDETEKPLDLGSPNGIAVDARNRIYIAERLANRLQIREILDAR